MAWRFIRNVLPSEEASSYCAAADRLPIIPAHSGTQRLEPEYRFVKDVAERVGQPCGHCGRRRWRSRFFFDRRLISQIRPVGSGDVQRKWLLESDMLSTQDSSAEHA